MKRPRFEMGSNVSTMLEMEALCDEEFTCKIPVSCTVIGMRYVQEKCKTFANEYFDPSKIMYTLKIKGRNTTFNIEEEQIKEGDDAFSSVSESVGSEMSNKESENSGHEKKCPVVGGVFGEDCGEHHHCDCCTFFDDCSVAGDKIWAKKSEENDKEEEYNNHDKR